MGENVKGKQKIAWAKTQLFLEHPWFGTLGMRLKFSQDEKIPTLATDGTNLIYNPEFILSLNNPELLGVIVHEILHCAMLHMFREGTRDHQRWNMAADYAINQVIIDQKFTLPPGCLIDPKYKGMAAEQIYARMPMDKNGGGGQGKGPGKYDPNCPTGTFEKPQPGQLGAPDQGKQPGQPGSEQMTETDWQMAVEQATILARKAGKLPGDMDRIAKEGRPSNTDWRELLWRFVQQLLPSDYSWSRPNRRFIHQGIYLPSLVKESMPKICFICDTSGSIGSDDIAMVKPEIDAILHSMKPECIEIIYCDSRVQKIETVTPEEGDTFEMKPKGGGGTEFQPAFDAVYAMDEPPCCIIYFTDLYASDIRELKEPDQPVLWMVPERYANQDIPFGQMVKVSGF